MVVKDGHKYFIFLGPSGSTPLFPIHPQDPLLTYSYPVRLVQIHNETFAVFA